MEILVVGTKNITAKTTKKEYTSIYYTAKKEGTDGLIAGNLLKPKDERLVEIGKKYEVIFDFKSNYIYTINKIE